MLECSFPGIATVELEPTDFPGYSVLILYVAQLLISVTHVTSTLQVQPVVHVNDLSAIEGCDFTSKGRKYT